MKSFFCLFFTTTKKNIFVEYCQAKLIQTLGRASQGVDWSWSQCIKSHHAQTYSGKGLPSPFWNYWNCCSVVQSPLHIKVNFAFHLEIKVCSLEEEWRGTESKLPMSSVWGFWSQRWFGVPWRLLVLVQCLLSSPQSMQPSTRRFWSTLCFHLLKSFREMLIPFSSRTLAPVHTAKTFFTFMSCEI